MLFLLIVTLLMVVLVVDHINSKRKNRPMENIPWFPYRNFPFIGQAYKFIGNDEDRMKNFQQIGRDVTDLGGLARFSFGRRVFLALTEPDDVQMTLRTCLEKDDLMDFMKDHLIGTGSLAAPVAIWKPRRRQTVHAFSSKMLQQFVEVFVQGGEELATHLGKVADAGPFHLWKYLASYTMDAVCTTNLGVTIDAQKRTEAHPFIPAFEKMMDLITTRMVQPWLHSDFLYKMLPQAKVLSECSAVVDNLVNSVVREKRAEKEGTKYARPAKNKFSQSMKPLVEILMDGVGDTGGLNDDELRDECKVIMAAGTDTTAVGSCFTLNQLARHPRVQEKVYQEVKEIFGDSRRPMVREDLAKLSYTEAVIRESLRLYPPVPVIIRKVDREVTLPSGHTLVPGTGVLIHIWMMLRNPKYWGEDAHLFRPDRFLDNPNPNPCYIPFSHGPRNCIGYQYAMMSMKTAVAHVVRSFRILPVPSKMSSSAPQHEPADSNTNVEEIPMRLKYDVMMRDVDNFPIQLETRK